MSGASVASVPGRLGGVRAKPSNRAVDRARGRSSRRAGRRGDACVREAGAFTKLIEIPLGARRRARAAVAPAKKFFLDGERRGESEIANVTVRAPDADVEAYDSAPMQALSGYDVGEVPFVMQAVCYYEETLDGGAGAGVERDAGLGTRCSRGG